MTTDLAATSSLPDLISRYKADPESVYNTWYVGGEARMKAFRSIRRGVRDVAAAASMLCSERSSSWARGRATSPCAKPCLICAAACRLCTSSGAARSPPEAPRAKRKRACGRF